MSNRKPQKNVNARTERVTDPVPSNLTDNDPQITLQKLQVDINKLSYEDSLNQLEVLMSELQSDDIALDDIQKYYIKANLFLAHCEKLLKGAAQEIIELNLESFEIKSD